MSMVPPAAAVPLDIPFKGRRTYLQGPDLFDESCRVLMQSGMLGNEPVSVAFKRFARTACALVPASLTNGKPPASWVAQIVLGDMDNRRLAWLIETGAVIERREEFEEQKIVDSAVFQADGASCATLEPFRPIEVAVALLKAVHSRIFTMDGGRWIVSKIQLEHAPPSTIGAGCVVRVDVTPAVVRNTTLNSIWLGETRGQVLFSWVRE